MKKRSRSPLIPAALCAFIIGGIAGTAALRGQLTGSTLTVAKNATLQGDWMEVLPKDAPNTEWVWAFWKNSGAASATWTLPVAAGKSSTFYITYSPFGPETGSSFNTMDSAAVVTVAEGSKTLLTAKIDQRRSPTVSMDNRLWTQIGTATPSTSSVTIRISPSVTTVAPGSTVYTAADTVGVRLTSASTSTAVTAPTAAPASTTPSTVTTHAASTCGNGAMEGTESCDDGNNTANDGCSGSCQAEYCGDSILQNPPEQCDDGNFRNGDGCTSRCSKETGSTTIYPGTTAPATNTTTTPATSPATGLYQPPIMQPTGTCGNDQKDAGEECEYSIICRNVPVGSPCDCDTSCHYVHAMGNYCGNQQCDGNETSTSCPADCKSASQSSQFGWQVSCIDHYTIGSETNADGRSNDAVYYSLQHDGATYLCKNNIMIEKASFVAKTPACWRESSEVITGVNYNNNTGFYDLILKNKNGQGRNACSEQLASWYPEVPMESDDLRSVVSKQATNANTMIPGAQLFEVKVPLNQTDITSGNKATPQVFSSFSIPDKTSTIYLLASSFASMWQKHDMRITPFISGNKQLPLQGWEFTSIQEILSLLKKEGFAGHQLNNQRNTSLQMVVTTVGRIREQYPEHAHVLVNGAYKDFPSLLEVANLNNLADNKAVILIHDLGITSFQGSFQAFIVIDASSGQVLGKGSYQGN